MVFGLVISCTFITFKFESSIKNKLLGLSMLCKIYFPELTFNFEICLMLYKSETSNIFKNDDFSYLSSDRSNKNS